MFNKDAAPFTIAACAPGTHTLDPLPFAFDEDFVGCPKNCALGTFATTIDLRVNVCPVCPSAHFCPDPMSEPIPCPSGTYSSLSQMFNESSCIKCPIGYQQKNKASTSCDGCIPGTFNPLEGASSCVSCSKGKFQEGTLIMVVVVAKTNSPFFLNILSNIFFVLF